MSTRKDFEIYEFRRHNRHYYAFKVDYIGYYIAQSEEEILKLQKKAKEYVKKKLAWVESENQKYYARLAEQERQRALLFKKAKQESRAQRAGRPFVVMPENEEQKLKLDRKIEELIKQGKDNDAIQNLTAAPYQQINAVRFRLQEE